MNTSSYIISDLQSERLTLPFYFLSDNHISTKIDTDQSIRIEEMLKLLEEIRESNGTLFILGDFFDFWFDKNKYIPPILKPIINAFKDIRNKGMEIHYIGGNHDYWIEGFLTEELGVKFYPDALQFSWEDKKIFCQHGDNVIYGSPQYPYFRAFIHSPGAVKLLKLLPIRLIYTLGERVSHYNRNIPEISRVSEFLVSKMCNFLIEKLDNGYHLALTGHVHAPLCKEHNKKTYAILGDWIHHRTYGYMDESGFKLIEIK